MQTQCVAPVSSENGSSVNGVLHFANVGLTECEDSLKSGFTISGSARKHSVCIFAKAAQSSKFVGCF